MNPDPGTFEWALQQLRAGKKVYRKAWIARWSRLQEHCWYQWVGREPVLMFLFTNYLRAVDMEAKDWEIYEPETI